MFHVEMYFQVRRACLVEGMSVREASRVFGVHHDTVRKMLANATPQGYTRKRPPRRPKLEPYTDVIDAILEADRLVPRKQRHTVKRIFERLRDEYGFEGQQTIVKDYVRERQGGGGRVVPDRVVHGWAASYIRHINSRGYHVMAMPIAGLSVYNPVPANTPK